MSTVWVEQRHTRAVSSYCLPPTSHDLTLSSGVELPLTGGTLAGFPNKLRFDALCSSSKVRRDVEL